MNECMEARCGKLVKSDRNKEKKIGAHDQHAISWSADKRKKLSSWFKVIYMHRLSLFLTLKLFLIIQLGKHILSEIWGQTSMNQMHRSHQMHLVILNTDFFLFWCRLSWPLIFTSLHASLQFPYGQIICLRLSSSLLIPTVVLYCSAQQKRIRGECKFLD